MNAAESPPRGRLAGVAALLAALTLALYARTGGFEFLNYDDPDYVSQNEVVAGGLSAAGVRWAFGFHAANWHPLTWLAHMLDVELFGLEPGPMHLVNAALHALNAALLLLALAELTRRLVPSLLVAALFAVHPLRVECVAWISERKELLASAFFFALLWAYGRHARTRGRASYLTALACLALGCMAKPMLVTAPFVLLLLDVWPLGRWPRGAGARAVRALVVAKLPFFAVACTAGVLTWLAQRAGGAVGELEVLPLAARLENAGAGVLSYLRAFVWPAGLAAFYPHPRLTGEDVLVRGLAGAALALGLSLVAWRMRAALPALFTGWFWFLGMLVPVIGLVQVGDQAWADRYTYLPEIGLALALVFGPLEHLRAQPARRGPLVAGACVAAGALAVVTLRTLPHWKDSQSLFERALAVTERNWIAHNNLGLAFLARRETAPARAHFTTALALAPWFHRARYNLALALEVDGERAEAERNYRLFLAAVPGSPLALERLAALERHRDKTPIEDLLQAVSASPKDARAWADLSRALLERGDDEGAGMAAKQSQFHDPELADSYRVLTEVALRRGALEEASRHVTRFRELAPADPEGHALLGRVRARRGELAEARADFERALALAPDSVRTHYDLGRVLVALGEGAAARREFEAVERLHPGDVQAALALAELDRNEGQPERARERLEGLIARQPEAAPAWLALAELHERLGRWKEALDSYLGAFERGKRSEAARAAAWILAAGPDETLFDGERALELAARGAGDTVVGYDADWLEVLAAAHARRGDFAAAVRTQEQAIARARGEKEPLEERLELYRAGKAYTRPR